ncbi:MAG: hypothetical protein U5L04_02685 [Trueperaceae bacterium]|nr:hypothetical protein [Trueperaceae bacterium]
MEHPVFTAIREEWERIKRRIRVGWYTAEVSGAKQSYRRTQIVPEWIRDGALDGARRIASPILDVIPPQGARMAVLSQDGVPEFAATIGQVFDDLTDATTVWLRANLEDSPGHLEVGADKGIRIRVGSNDANDEAAFAMNETADGELVIESDDGGCSVTLKPGGNIVLDTGGATVHLAGTSGKLVALGPDANTEHQNIASAIGGLVDAWNAAVSAAQGAGAPQPVQATPSDNQVTPYTSSSVSAANTKAE